MNWAAFFIVTFGILGMLAAVIAFAHVCEVLVRYFGERWVAIGSIVAIAATFGVIAGLTS